MTVTVIVLVPLAFAAGVSVIVRFAPLPPRLIPLAATTFRFEEVAVTVSDPAAVSASPAVNAIAEVGVSSFVLCAAIADMVGKSFTAVRLIAKLVVVVSAPSLTDTVKVSVVAALSALIAAAFGVNVYAPLVVVTVSVP